MTTFTNPLAHVAPTPAEQLFISAGGKEIAFRAIGLQSLAFLAERFPALKAKMSGNGADLTLTPDEEQKMSAAMIAIAIAPDGVTTEQLAEIEANAANLKPIERDIAVGMIYKASMPDTAEEAPNFTKPVNRKTRRAAKSTLKKTAIDA